MLVKQSRKKKEAAVLAENLEKELQQVEESIVSLKKDLTLDELTEIEDEQKAIEENTKKNIVEKKKKKQSWISFKRKKRKQNQKWLEICLLNPTRNQKGYTH